MPHAVVPKSFHVASTGKVNIASAPHSRAPTPVAMTILRETASGSRSLKNVVDDTLQ
jgi:hypothetical protein